MHQNEMAEKATIGLILKDSYRIKETKLRPEHFYFDNGRIIFEAMKRIDSRGGKIDTITVCQELSKGTEFQNIGGAATVVELERDYYRGDFEEYERIVIENWKCRHARDLAKTFMYAVDDSKDPAEIGSLIKHLQDTEELGLDADDDAEGRLDAWYENRATREGMIGVTTGYKDIDAMLGGYMDECLYILAARPAVGKTALMLCSALHTCAADSVTVIFSLEMPMEQLLDRMACAIGTIDAYKLKEAKARFTEDDWQRFNKAFQSLRTLIATKRLVIYDKSGITIQEIRSKLRTLRRKNPNKRIVAMADYLQLIRTTSKHKDRRLEVSEVSQSLKEISRQLKMPFIALAQLSRSVEMRQDKRPMMSDLKESGDIEADADVISFLYREDYYNPETEKKNIVEYIIAKNRHGASGIVELVFLKQFGKYISLQRTP